MGSKKWEVRKGKDVVENNSKLDKLGISENKLFFIGGPCVIEDEETTYEIAFRLKEITARHDIPFVFKASYDKANRTSVSSYRGPGIDKGLIILNKIKEKLNVPILSDVHCCSELKKASEVLDIIQIPAFLCRQTDLLVESGNTGCIINIKKGQFIAPWDMKNIIEKVVSTGNNNIILTERGFSFGYNNLVSDMRSIIIMRQLGYPVVFDATHSVQLPGGAGNCSGGESKYVPQLAYSACGAGCNGLFFEVHPDPKNALCDGANSLAINDLEDILKKAKQIKQVLQV